MTKANEIMSISRNANDACERAEAEAETKIDQDWENEATLYTFADESVLVISGPQVNAFDDMESARAAIEA